MSDRLNIRKGKVGSNTLGGYEKVSALIGSFGEIKSDAGELAVGVPIQFRNLIEAEGFGIKANPLLRHHISEYFRIGGTGASLWVLNVQAYTSFANLINDESVKTLIAKANGEIFQMAFAYIPQAFEYTDGVHTGMLPAIKAAQVLADWTRETNRPLHTILECAGYKGASAVALNLRDIKEGETLIECNQVSVVIGQDYDFAETLTGSEQKYAAVGTLLGCMAVQPVSYNIGEVETMSLTNSVRGLWVNAGLSSHELVKDKESELSTLNTKGYIFGEYYSGQVVFNDDHVCAPVIVDDEGNMNEHTISLSRTNAKVFRELFRVYEPKLKSTVPVDAQTGLLPTGIIKELEGYGDGVFDTMQKKRELSGGETIVDPESNLLYGDKELKVSYNWVPMGVISRISGVVNIKRALV